MFEAIQRADSASLRELAQGYIRSGNGPATLLCLDRVFSFPFKLRNLSLSEVRESLSLYHNYIRLLNKLRRDQSLAEGSDRQKLFGFRLRERNLYLVPEHSTLHKKLTGKSGPNRKGSDGRCSHEELTQVINHFVLGRIQDRTEMQNDACYGVYGFSPCLRFLIQRKCDPSGGKGGKESCAFQHNQQDKLTIDWYQARVRLILLQFQILDSARYCGRDVKEYVPVCGNCVCTLTRYEAIGLGYCIRRFTHLFGGSDRSRTSILPVYPKEMTVLGLCGNGFETPATTSITTPRNQQTDNVLWLRVHWHSILTEIMLSTLSLLRRCTGWRADQRRS